MAKFPVDAPKRRVVKALEKLGFEIAREKEHISMVRENDGGTLTALTMAITRACRDPRCDQSVRKRVLLAMSS
jgi:predicted RNA binding protein YcfA (HicA-like mRNA interferase family)